MIWAADTTRNKMEYCCLVLFYAEDCQYKYRLDMFTKACLVIVLGCLSVANAQTPFCSGDLCFMKLENSGKTWTQAQQRCKENNSTLPIADDRNRQKYFVDALSYFQLNGFDVWLGAIASDYGSNNWRWLDESQYAGTVLQQQGEYSKSYAYIAKRTAEVLAYASPPIESYSYICQCNVIHTDVCTNGTRRTAFVKENRCYMMYEERLPWFSARNKCLENSCDLASFSQLSLLDGMVDSSEFWVGLRHSQWNWQNAVTGSLSEVTFTSWRIGQPNAPAPQCMATDSGDFPNWKDYDCTTQVYSYICQVSDIRSSSTPYSSSTTTTSTSTSSTSTTTSTSTTKSPVGTEGTSTSATTSTSLSSTPKMSTTLHTANENAMNSINTGSVNMALAIGLGVGLGVPFIILIVVVIVYVAVIRPRKHRNSGENRNARSTEKFVTNDGQENTDNGTTETIDKKKKGKTPPENSSAQYATIREANPGGNLVAPSNEGTVYADLRFDE